MQYPQDKPQKVTAKEAACSECHTQVEESWAEENSVVEKKKKGLWATWIDSLDGAVKQRFIRCGQSKCFKSNKTQTHLN